jgi:hypothetical protein
MPQPPKLQPALFGGLFIGVLSALPLVNVCCCLWLVGGGIIAAYLMQQNHPDPITAADGALVGLLAGLFGGILGVLLSIPINMAMGPVVQEMIQGWVLNNPDLPSESRSMIENMMARGVGPSVIGTIFSMGVAMVAGAIFGMLGGLLGVALFKKKDMPPPPGTVEILPPA